ncbi:DUF1254 domain-containing protein [Edaphobacter modestus]|uniref:DUF1254 domain-containing protein n=1 Tax=Edaphobacter modestus TaxID=388466 RepID=UPI002415240D|nr:DUF1254 domain-containing protein [Edaphobacter modestus]
MGNGKWDVVSDLTLVVTVPKIEPNRYYTGQMVDLYTYNFAYLGTRAFGNDGGTFLIAGPGWNGATPAGVKAVIRSETQFAYIIFRTQLFNVADLPKVNKIQAGYHAEPLSNFTPRPHPASSPSSTSYSSSARRVLLRQHCSHDSRRSTSAPGRPST